MGVRPNRRAVGALGFLMFVGSSCSLVPDTDASGSVSASGVSADGASASGVSTGETTEGVSSPFGGYAPISDVGSHSLVTLDVCDVRALLDEEAIDWSAVGTVYQDGGQSVKGDGSVRTLSGFATSERDEPIWNEFVTHFGDPVWIDSYVMAAVGGTGVFEGETDAVRRQGAQKGIQNQLMVAWAVHELVAAEGKVESGEIDPAGGAPHNVDEAWAFYHGAAPDCSPFATANSRGEDFGVGSAVNDAVTEHIAAARDAAVAGDGEAYRTAMDGAIGAISTTYLQAAEKYSIRMGDKLDEGDAEGARVQQAEGWSFYRVVQPLVAAADPAADEVVVGYLHLDNDPVSGAGPDVRAALESVYVDLGTSSDDIGSFG